ncbi:MAG: GHKL domain-containing protein [Desulfomonile tiedjei]|nr:GHKL domain-containing protein [Desulfomonile tiedjei]
MVTGETRQSTQKGRPRRSAYVLATILVLLAGTTVYVLFRLYQTSALLAESDRKAFRLETTNKASVLNDYFRRRMREVMLCCQREVFQMYYDSLALGLSGNNELEVVSGQIEEALLLTRLEIEEQGRPVYASAAFFDLGTGSIVARTDFSPKGRWITEDLFASMRTKTGKDVTFGRLCDGGLCKIFALGVVRHAGKDKGLLLMELSAETVWSKIQLLGLEAVDDFSGLADSDGVLVLGPPTLLGLKIQDTLGLSPEALEDTRMIDGGARAARGLSKAAAVSGSKLPESGFYLVHVAPRSKFVEGHSPILWTLVFASLMGGLVLVLLHISKSQSERNLMYNQLREAHEHLEQRVQERTAELEHLNQTLRLEISERQRVEEVLRKTSQDLEAANQELKDFAYIVSHDLKAPLRAANQLVGWLATDYGHLFDEEGKGHLDLLLSRVTRMHNLIDSILHYSRLGRIREEQTAVDLNILVSEVIQLVGPPAHISITVENELPTIICEETRIQELFQNLLDNAIKYSDKPEGRIRIGCAREDSHWKFGISDNGPGIDQKYHEKVFQIFQTLHSRDEVESTGIGLTVVRKIVELHGGKVWVESQMGSGTTFFFTLPDARGES